MNDAPAPGFAEQLRSAPARPGVYLFLDRAGQVLYVGKALDLRKRVAAYLREGGDGRPRLRELHALAVAAEFRVTDSEREAILLEDRLVKHHQPPLNVLLKDDKSFLYVHLDTAHTFPRLGLARRRGSHGLFHGPYASAGVARRTKRLLMQGFGLRDCSDHAFANRARPCLKYEIGLCCGPCVGKVSAEEYAERLDAAREVLGGQVAARLRSERTRMAEASAREDYEIALRARDRARALAELAEPQKVRLEAGRDFDVLGLDERGHFALLQYRDGAWLHTREGRVPLWEDPAAAVSELLAALYRSPTDEVPPEILVSAMPEDAESLAAGLSERSGCKVRVFAPARGERRALVRMAASNARAQRGETSGAAWEVAAQRLAEIARCALPSVVDCVDASHLQGQDRVASRVRFVEGRPAREAYRHYLIGGGEGNDDPGAMREIVARLVKRAADEGLPDLLVLDGGRPQLSAALEVLGPRGVDLPVIALAKARRGRGPVAAEERLFLPGRPDPVILERGTPERLFLERIRDEAHRFAIGFHRRRRENLRLVLEQVPGIGPKRRAVLLDWCAGQLSQLRDANPRDLAALPGISWELIEPLQEHLRRVLP
ncbi:MAG: excinuclease ABC subunit UvrC [Planctomycetota bacterium]|nr:excinuclease ABC subunit UvrC [Planctomycetota bacterium]